MRIYGLDFTSAPGRRKPMTLAQCELDGDVLAVRDLLRLSSFEQFERCLAAPGTWVAAMDFPFGQPRSVVAELGWPTAWEACARHVGGLERDAFADALMLYKAARPAGRKELRRATDELARALSPMKLAGTPLALMFHAGAPRLAASPLSVLPCRPRREPRIVLEGYPALVARRLVGQHGYKSDGRETAAQRNTRRALVDALRSDALAEHYGLRVEIGNFLGDALAAESRGDLLDAVLAAVQAGWAANRSDEGFGVPERCDPLEGWIVDPDTLAGWRQLTAVD